MANKKDQHIVPRCYLKHFVDSSLANDNKKFEAGVFVNSSALNKPWKMKGLDNKVFTKTRFYNLKSDDPDSPVIEDHLATVESYYTQAITQLHNDEFSNDILSILTLFVIHQFFRSERTVNNLQKSWDKISECADLLEGGERNRSLYGEISKKQILYLSNPETLNPIHKNAGIIINSTRIPFLTSDRPVIKNFYNQEDLSKIFHSLQQKNYNNQHLESPFYFMPLTPWLAYVSHSCFNGETKGFECPHENVISKLNDMMLLNASEHVYSFMNNPVNSLPVAEKQNGKSQYFMVKVFTQSKRVIFEVKSYHRDKLLLTLDAVNICFPDELVEGQQIISVEVFDLNFSRIIGVAGTSGCEIKTIDKASNKIVFETNLC